MLKYDDWLTMACNTTWRSQAKMGLIASLFAQLICAWKDEGKDVFLRHPPFELEKDGDEGACTIVFDALLAKCESLQVSYILPEQPFYYDL